MGDAYVQDEGFDGYSGGESTHICNFVSPDGDVVGVRAKRKGNFTCAQLFGDLVGAAIPIDQLSLDGDSAPIDEAGYLILDGQTIGVYACTSTSGIQVAGRDFDEQFVALLGEVIDPPWD